MAEETKILKIKLTKPTVVGERATKKDAVVELPEAEAKNLIRRGRAVAVKAEPAKSDK